MCAMCHQQSNTHAQHVVSGRVPTKGLAFDVAKPRTPMTSSQIIRHSTLNTGTAKDRMRFFHTDRHGVMLITHGVCCAQMRGVVRRITMTP